jgi:hypothetical protein
MTAVKADGVVRAELADASDLDRWASALVLRHLEAQFGAMGAVVAELGRRAERGELTAGEGALVYSMLTQHAFRILAGLPSGDGPPPAGTRRPA